MIRLQKYRDTSVLRIFLLTLLMVNVSLASTDSTAEPVQPQVQRDKCPSSNCTCIQQTHIYCRSMELTAIPQFTPSNITYDELVLSYNKITEIGPSAFAGIRFRRLEMNNNNRKLERIDDGSFDGLEDILTKVSLQLGPNTAFPTVALSRLRNLKVLNITNYALKRLPPEAFKDMKSLKELRLQFGELDAIGIEEFVPGGLPSLEILDLEENGLHTYPTEVMNDSLPGLLRLSLRRNAITHLGPKSVTGSRLEELHITLQINAGIDVNAFTPVASTLSRLVIQRSSLEDEQVSALTKLKGLTHLDVSMNRLSRSVVDLLAHLPSLVELSASNNSIHILTRSGLSPGARHLVSLDLSYNPLSRVDADAFYDLKTLRVLNLDYTKLRLNPNSFVGQRASITSLRLRGVDLSEPQWSIVDGLTQLRTVHVDGCRLGNIPDMLFVGFKSLELLSASDNQLTTLGQRSLVGLQDSLTYLGVQNNRLTTLDRCVFHGFQKLTPINTNLGSNSLSCGCDAHWLFSWADDSLAFLSWQCADGRNFRNLNEHHFNACDVTTVAPTPACEDLLLTTASVHVEAVTLYIVNYTGTTVSLRWLVSTDAKADGFRLTWIDKSGVRSWSTLLDQSWREYQLAELYPGAEYRICVVPVIADVGQNWTSAASTATVPLPATAAAFVEASSGSCVDAVTVALWFRDPLIVGAIVVGASLVVGVVVLTIACLTVRRARRRRRREIQQAQPKVVDRTRHFMRPGRPCSMQAVHVGDHPGTTNIDRTYSRSMDARLNTMYTIDDVDRYRLIQTLLRGNAATLGNVYHGNGRAVDSGFGQPADDEQEVYDEINDDEIRDEIELEAAPKADGEDDQISTDAV